MPGLFSCLGFHVRQCNRYWVSINARCGGVVQTTVPLSGRKKHKLQNKQRSVPVYNCRAFLYDGNSIPLLTLYTSRLFLRRQFLYNNFVNMVTSNRSVSLIITWVEFTVHLSNLHHQSSPCLPGLGSHEINKRPGDNLRQHGKCKINSHV